MPILATISTSLIVMSGVFVAIGWSLIRAKKIEQHKRMMLIASICAICFFIIYASRTAFVGNTTFGGPEEQKIYYQLFLYFHITLATIGAVLGGITIYTGLKNNLRLHRKLGPPASVIWLCTSVTGVAVYTLLYILYTPGETAPMIEVIFGGK